MSRALIPRDRRFIAGAALSLTAGLIASALTWHLLGPVREAQAQARPPVPPTVLVSSPVVRDIIDWREFSGRFEPSAAVDIRARVTGHLDTIAFDDGAIVQAGQLLFVIDPRPYRTALDQERAQHASAEAQVELADLELKRAEQLVSSNAVSQATLDQRRQQKKAADATRALAAAAVSRAEIELGFTEVRAPFAGRVSNRRVDTGALVTDGAMLTTLVALDPVYFVFDISEQDLMAYQAAARGGELPLLHGRGIPVQARGQSDKDWPLSGTVDFVDNRLEAGAGTIRARALLPNTEQRIIAGQFGRVRLPFSGSYAATMVPETALLTDQADRMVLTVDADGTVRSSKVNLGARQADGMRIVRSGVGPQDRVVVSGLLRARPGQKVTAKAAEGEPRAASIATPAGG